MKIKENIKYRLYALSATGPMALFLYLYGQTIKYDRIAATLYGVSASCWLAVFLIFTINAIMLEREKKLLEIKK